ncbi:MAG: class I tRNA ligase family protein, partial [Rickettsiales bacterium]|nr:class I tRNA ligase family protein [Rickettsiales bacterium]
WCISRQRYFGVPFPVWYSKRAGDEGKILVANADQLPVNPLVDLPEGYSREEVEAEADVMDTWATSSVSPQLSSKAINKEHAVDYARHEKLFPADLRPQAHEIIRTWAFYTIVKAHLHEDAIPWKNLMISGWCLAEDKTKMSKSKGNVVTPVDLIEEEGADVVRYWSSTSRLGADTAFSRDVLKIGKKLVNKLWNATKFGAIQLEKLSVTPSTPAGDVANGTITHALDQWILTRLHRAITKATAEFEQFEYCKARVAVEDFFWNDFCDNYLEIVKKRAYNEDGSDDAGQQSAIVTVYHCLEAVLRLFAPIVPHVTEELYSHIFEENYAKIGSLHARKSWPDAAQYPVDESAEATGIATVSVLNVVRKMKADQNVSLKWPITALSIAAGSEGGAKAALEPAWEDLANVTNATQVEWVDAADSNAESTEDNRYAIRAEFASESDAA